MEKAIAVLCVLVLSITSVDGYVEYSGVDIPGFTNQDGNEGDNIWSDITTVTMPDNMLKEAIHYDHLIKIEVYFENKTSGEWTYWALDVSGQELIKVPGVAGTIDGFGEDHSALYVRRELTAQFTITLDDSEGESVTSDGEYDVQRDEFTDLLEEKVIRIDTNANISVEELPSTTIPLSFRGFTRSYFDPALPVLETLEDSVYGEGQTIKLGDSGEWVDETTWTKVGYDWVAERGEVIAGYDTILINVSTDFGDDNFSLPFKEMVWIAGEVSYPVKQFLRTNTSWDTTDEAGYFLIENTFILRDSGFTPGNSPIPWGSCSGYHWLTMHPFADTQAWDGNFMPKSGSGWEDSSFHWRPEEVISWLEEDHPSEGLEQYLAKYPDAIITNAVYNASLDESDPEGLAGEFWWNLTFGIERQPGQQGSSWNLENRYQLLVYNVTDWEYSGNPLDPIKHNVELTVLLDMGKRSGTAPITEDDLQSKTVTMASSEKIFKTDDMVINNFYKTPAGLPRDTLDWGNGDGAGYSLEAGEGGQGGGMDLIATLTGIQTQTWGKYTWSVYEEDLMEGGTMSSCTLDAESGRLINYFELEGTALQNAFKFGD